MQTVLSLMLLCAGCGVADGVINHVAPSGPTTCDTYCGIMAVHCTRGNVQYADDDACMSACAGYASSPDPDASRGDTLECRMVYAIGAEHPELKRTFCDNAGPTGGTDCLP